MISAIVTDIEGTTSSISFVKDILFPYAADHLPDFVRARQAVPEISAQLDATARLSGLARDDIDGLIRQLLDWIAADVKATPLKALQGMIWKHGYVNGDYQAHIYADAAQKLIEWRDRGLELFVYSSGSVRAQTLFFQYSVCGDIRPLFRGHFDTTTGAKRDPDSYRTITRALARPAAEILFLSDVEAELDAARAAGLHTCWLIRPDDSTLCAAEVASEHAIAESFADITPESFG